jgi:mannosyl-3-phosphoglycerate phosphatase
MGKSRLLVFTDLDGTLLDHATYSFEAAAPALLELKERGIPLILCTSKTRAETEAHRRALGNTHPFVTENGGAVYIPEGYFNFEKSVGPKRGLYEILEFGTSYEKLRRTLGEIRGRLGSSIRGFGDMSVEEVAGLCGFDIENAALAKEREYDEPFLVPDDTLLTAVRGVALEAGLNVVTGGRFHHLVGDNDKGTAVTEVTELYKLAWGPCRSVALGDSLNDLPMLLAVDIPVLVRKPGGTYDPGIRIPGLVFAPGAGPEGWAETVLGILRQETLFP